MQSPEKGKRIIRLGHLLRSLKDLILRRHLVAPSDPGQTLMGVASEQSNAVGRVTGGVAHEFNNLLTVVLGNAVALRVGAEARGDEVAIRRAELIERAAEKGSRFAAQLLSFSGKQLMMPQVVSAYDVVSHAHHLLAGAAGEAIQLTLTAERNLWLCRIDPRQLEAAILNLVLNARDAMPEGGGVTIRFRNRRMAADPARAPWRAAGEYVSIDVQDHGIGIPAEHQGKVFEPFFTTKPVGQGSGLGLAQVHGFARQSDGWVELESAVGRGTTVSLFLPRFRGGGGKDSGPDNGADPATKIVLFVEPDATLRRQSREALGAAGYALLEATTGSSAITHLVSDARIDLMITAERLTGGISGSALGRHALSLRPNMDVLVCSPDWRDAPRGSSSAPAGARGRFEFLAKPYRPEDLVAVVAGLIATNTFSTATEDLLADVRDVASVPVEIVPLRTAAEGPDRPDVRGNTIRLGVWPFRALGADNQALCLGLAEEISAAVAAFRMIECVAPASLAAVAQATENTAQLWKDLDLDYRVEGTLRRKGGELQVFVRLLQMGDAEEITWSRRFSSQVSEALQLQDSIAREIAAQVAPQVLMWEGRRAAQRPRVNATAWDLTLRAIPAIYSLEQRGFTEAGELLKRAVAMDPSNASAHSWLAHWYLFKVGQGWAQQASKAAEKAERVARRAIALDPDDSRALTVAGHVLAFLRHDAETGLALHEKALALNPSLALAWCYAGLAQCYLGNHAEAIRAILHARRLSPHDPHGFFFDTALFLPYFLLGEYETAAQIGRRARDAHPGVSSTYKVLLATLGMMGATAEAAAVQRALLHLEPGFCIQDAIERSPLLRKDDRDHYSEGLRRAGLPERSRDTTPMIL